MKCWSWFFKTIISHESNAFESNHNDGSDIGGIYITFLEKTFYDQSILTLHKAFKVTLFTIILLLRQNTTAVDSVVNITLNLARYSKTILSRRTELKEKGRWKIHSLHSWWYAKLSFGCGAEEQAAKLQGEWGEGLWNTACKKTISF